MFFGPKRNEPIVRFLGMKTIKHDIITLRKIDFIQVDAINELSVKSQEKYVLMMKSQYRG